MSPKAIGTAGNRSRRAVLLVSCVGLVAAAAAQADTQPVLRIVFPEGLTARQMADQSAHVRRIAIAKRGVTPRLSASLVRRRDGSGSPTGRVPAFPEAAQRGGIPFPPCTSSARPPPPRASSRSSSNFPALEHLDLRAAKARGRTPYDVPTIASLVEKETVANEERAFVAAVVYNRLERPDAARDRRLAPLRPRDPGDAADHALASPERHAVQHTPLPGAAADPDREPRPPLDQAARGRRGSTTSTTFQPDGVHHFFTADEQEFCRKAVEYGYRGR